MDNRIMAADQQALISAPQVSVAAECDKISEMKKKEKRFQAFGIGSFLYALFYTFCLYHNTSGITYPFFAGGTLLFFGYFIKKSGSSSADGKKEHIEIYNDDSSIYYRRTKVYQRQTKGITGARKFNFSRAYAAQKIDF